MYLPPASDLSSDMGGPPGHSYGAVLVPESEASHEAVLGVLRGIRFSGWVAPPAAGWLVALGDPGGGVVAAERRGIVGVGETVAGRLGGRVLVALVRDDRQLALVGWRGDEEVCRYDSDPSREPKAAKDVIAEPVGAESAADLAELFDRPDAAERLGELLEEELDPDSVNESERLGEIATLLGLPRWLVAAGALPRDIPTGPRAKEFIRLRAGMTGAAGTVAGALVRPVRRRRTSPPVIDDPPRQDDTIEPWMLGL